MARQRLDPHYFTIKEFKRAGDDRFWRLHWFGKLDFNLKNLEPLIETTLVPLRDPRLDPEQNPPELLDNDSYDFKRSMTVFVGVGQLPLFGHGVFFQHGRPVARPPRLHAPRVQRPLYRRPDVAQRQGLEPVRLRGGQVGLLS